MKRGTGGRKGCSGAHAVMGDWRGKFAGENSRGDRLRRILRAMLYRVDPSEIAHVAVGQFDGLTVGQI